MTVSAADRLSLTVKGPFGAALTGQGDNLILTALRRLGEAAGIGDPAVAVTLDKRLPIAAGLGGGSSDAAVALRLTDAVLDLGLGEARLAGIARVIGADGPMCLAGRTAWAEGVGDRLSLERRLPPLHAVLANPGRPSPTGAVYRAYDTGLIPGPTRTGDRPGPPGDWSPPAVIDWLAHQRNDLQGPAADLEPVIGQALTAMDAAGSRLTRMSGSGATVFGLFEDARTAHAAATALRAAHDDWWITATLLGDTASSSSEYGQV